jgi:DNA helicase-2/ATP-dependent DNA helicase PcrA
MPGFTPTPEQQAILAHAFSCNARILAGPGTGKSATLVALLNQLLSDRPSSRVRLLTFTRAATAELAKKVSEHPAAVTQRPSTIHSFAISVLLRNPGAGNFPQPLRIADDWEDENIVQPTLAERIKVPVRKLRRLVREMAANWESLCPEKDPHVDPAERARFIGAWTEHRQTYGYTLLGELPFALRNALRDHPDLAGVDFELLVVDEYQDLNACDLDVLKLIAQRGCSIIGAGDDDQSIYSFRRAAPEGIRRFPSDYPGAADYALSVTQRCGSRIMDWATYVIEGDPDRPRTKPRLKSAKGSPSGDVALLSFAGEVAEAKGIATLIEKLRARGIPPAEILVLLRGDHNGTFSKAIKEQLEKLHIQYSDPEAVKRLLGEPGNRQMLEVFRLVFHREDSLAWASLLLLTSGIGKAFFKYIYERARKDRKQFGPTLLSAYNERFVGWSLRVIGSCTCIGPLDADLARRKFSPARGRYTLGTLDD